jgi:uncharacterized protein (DUF2147 family)
MKYLITIFTMLISLNGYSQNADFIVGKWKIKAKNITVETKKENSFYVGYITSSTNSANIGDKVIWGLTFDENDKEWTSGTLKLPEMSHTASSNITFKNQNEILIRGYHGLKLFGKTVVATKL